jgi:S-adenosylmethionine:tRNA ribosyltransferase-isomerase
LTADRNLRTSDFDYDLSPELIAQEPPADRGASRLLVLRRAQRAADESPHHRPPLPPLPALPPLEDRHFSDLPSLIPPGDLLVLNTTRVRHARLLGTRPSGAPAEVLLVHPAGGEGWVAMGHPGSALQPGKRIRLGGGVEVETIEILADGHRVVRFLGTTAEDAIRRFGRLPLPPYIGRAPTALDDDRYQTVFAERAGSVAAPTAGLHFTTAMLAALEEQGVGIARLDLEVGPGTFKPVEDEDLTRHRMHPERFTIPPETAERISSVRRSGGAVWAVGTTVVRALESAVTPQGDVAGGSQETRLMITPGYRFRVADHLLTNFHLPRSTLLMLVAAFAGLDRTLAAYRHAVAGRYRFFSYGDAMLVL